MNMVVFMTKMVRLAMKTLLTRKVTSSAPEKRLALAMPVAAAKRRMSILRKELDADAGCRIRSILDVV